jgi:tetratricopeptide (TPR) repeat protein/DNA-binding CsgD family transcriptional regulator
MRMLFKQSYRTLYLLVFLSLTTSAFSQNSDAELKKDLQDNGQLFSSNADKAFRNIDALLKRAAKQKNHAGELTLLDRKCRYFYIKNQIDKLIVSAEELESKALEYEDVYFQGMSNIYLAESYSINGFSDRAISYLDEAYKILKNDNSGQKRIFLAKTNVLNSYANIYSDMGQPKKAIQKLREIIKSSDELKNKVEEDQFQYVNYSNIASLYENYNFDSARYFALKSMELKPKGKNDDGVMMMNYYLLGQAYKQNSNIKEAITNYHKALQVSKETGLELNQKIVYQSLIELYQKIGKKDSAIIYDNKLKQLENSMLQSKYNSLQKVIVEDHKKDHISPILIYGSICVVILLLVLIIFFIGKPKNNLSQTPQESYLILKEMAEKNDPAFMFTFDQIFPNFSETLLKINPELQKSEIEFCALLKLNISTKEISKITFVETRTVQNKKYRIRKKLNIPPSTDIYTWFYDK